MRCKQEPFYFFEKYTNIKLLKFQLDIMKSYFENKFNVTACSRETGMGKIIGLLTLYELCFNVNKEIVLFTHKNDNGVVIIEHIKELYRKLPFFLKPGIKSWNNKSITFDNSSRVKIKTNTKEVLGYSINISFIVDFAFHKPDFFNTLCPITAALKDTKMFIVSSINGLNHFYDLLINAERKEGDPLKNNFKAHRVYYWEVPGRDEKWKDNKISELGGDVELFNREYDLSFKPNKIK